MSDVKISRALLSTTSGSSRPSNRRGAKYRNCRKAAAWNVRADTPDTPEAARLQMIGESDADHVSRVARRLCVGPDRHAEVQQLLEAIPPPAARDVTTLWWDTAGS